MSDNILAKRFKARRLELKMSQVQVAEGICKQARISRIEKGDYSPGAELLYKLAKKMHVSVEYFFDESVEEEAFENLGKFKELSRKLLDQRDYESLKYIYEMEVEKEQALSTSDKLYLEWIGCMVDFHAEGSQKQAIGKLENLLAGIRETDSLYFTLINALLGFYIDSKDKRVLDKYKEIYTLLLNIQTTDVDNLNAIMRIRYNYCRYLWKNNYLDEAKNEILISIELYRKYEVSTCQADTYCILGNVYRDTGEKEKAKKYYEIALVLYGINSNEKIVKELREYIEENYSK